MKRTKSGAVKGGVASADALVRAREGKSNFNVPKILSFFNANGIAVTPEDVRENVLTFKAWMALGQVVKKGEHGCHIVVFGKDEKTGKTRGYGAVVFHRSQTEAYVPKTHAVKPVTPTVAPIAPTPSAPTTSAHVLYSFDALRRMF